MFKGAAAKGPRPLFKGGTSLSKAYGLISRFSEDIDITIFRDDLGQSASIEELEEMSGKKRRARLDAIKAASQVYVNEAMSRQIISWLGEAMQAVGEPTGAPRVPAGQASPQGPTRGGRGGAGGHH